MQSTPKLSLLNEIEKRITSVQPKHIDVVVIDGNFFLHLFVDLPSTIGQTATTILKKICSTYNSDNIHLVFDKMVIPSIKDLEHQSRNSVDNEEYIISGPEQKRPKIWLKALCNSSFKTTFIEFLIRYWENNHFHSFISRKKLYVTCENDCYLFEAHRFCSENPMYKFIFNSSRSRFKNVISCCLYSITCKYSHKEC